MDPVGRCEKNKIGFGWFMGNVLDVTLFALAGKTFFI